MLIFCFYDLCNFVIEMQKTGIWWESSKESDHSEDQGVDGGRDLRETGWGGVDWI
jgi:hypothetical protein